ncbi:MAG: glycine zipper 2TM domain-containing protein [Colwellia sp.]|nr:glycine zipper 2TM domain-containing protein [Colwellia sp.]
MKSLFLSCLFLLVYAPLVSADYDRNSAVAVEKVLFGKINSVRNITQKELIADKNQGWKVFGGALIGGVIGNQFGGGSGRDIATVLGAIIGGNMANNRNPEYTERTIYLVELMIKVDQGKEYMVIQDLDSKMVFHSGDAVRLIYLEGGTVRIDKQM